MIGTDEATAATEHLAMPWPTCARCGEPHAAESRCQAAEAPMGAAPDRFDGQSPPAAV
jgi:hypothetical protein